jgi:predicted nucleic acid-binding Zn ribbon protein
MREALRQAAPSTPLALVQASWREVVGERIAAIAEPSSERLGTLVVSCADPVWAQELELMQEELLGRLRERLGADAPHSLKFRVKSDPK